MRTTHRTVCVPISRARQQAHRHPHADLARATPHQRPHTPCDRRDHSERHECVHGGRTVAGVTPGRLVERPGRPRDHGSSQTETHPLPPVELRGFDHRQHHHRERADDGDHETPADVGEMGRRCDLGGGLASVGRCRHRSVAEIFDGRHQSFDTGCSRIVHVHGGLRRGVVDRRSYTVEAIQFLFDTRRTSGAGHPRDSEDDRLVMSRSRCG